MDFSTGPGFALNVLNYLVNIWHCCRRLLFSTTSQLRALRVSAFTFFCAILLFNSLLDVLNIASRKLQSLLKLISNCSATLVLFFLSVDTKDVLDRSSTLASYSCHSCTNFSSFKSSSPSHLSLAECCKASLTSVPFSLIQKRPLGLVSFSVLWLVAVNKCKTF